MTGLEQAGRKLAAIMPTSRADPGTIVRRGTVTNVSREGGGVTLDVALSGGTLPGVVATVDCSGAKPGDSVLVCEYAHITYAVGILASDDQPTLGVTGSIVLHPPSSSVNQLLFTADQFRELTGREPDRATVTVCNGDFVTTGAYVLCAVFRPDNKNWYVHCQEPVGQIFRVNYTISFR